MKLLGLLFLCICLTFAVAGQSGSEKTKITADIQKVMENQTAAWNTGNIDAFMNGYWQSDNLIFISGENVTRGWQPTLDRYKKSYDTRAKMGVLKFSDLEFLVLAKDAAVVLGSWQLTREKDSPKGKFTLTFRKFKEGWRIIMDHTS